MKVRWKYNRFGHVEIWDEANQEPRESDIYLQTEEDVEAFFNHIGQDINEVFPGQSPTPDGCGHVP